MKPKASWLKSLHFILLALGFLLGWLLLSGCKAHKATTTQLVQRDTVTQVTIRERIDTVAIPGDLVRDTIRAYITDTIYKESGRARLKQWQTSSGQIVAQAECLPDTVYISVTDTTTTTTTREHKETYTLKQAEPSWWQRFRANLGSWVLVLLGAGLLLVAVRFLTPKI